MDCTGSHACRRPRQVAAELPTRLLTPVCCVACSGVATFFIYFCVRQLRNPTVYMDKETRQRTTPSFSQAERAATWHDNGMAGLRKVAGGHEISMIPRYERVSPC